MKLLPLLAVVSFSLTLQPAFAADERKPEVKKAGPGKTDPKKKDEKKPEAKPASGLPPKKQKTDMVEEDTVALLKPFDTNSDFEIDVDEFKAIETEFKKNPKGPLKAFDKGKDGALDAMIDRTGINVKLGSAAPKKKPAASSPAKKAEPAKKPEAPKKPEPAPAAPPAAKKP